MKLKVNTLENVVQIVQHLIRDRVKHSPTRQKRINMKSGNKNSILAKYFAYDNFYTNCLKSKNKCVKFLTVFLTTQNERGNFEINQNPQYGRFFYINKMHPDSTFWHNIVLS